MPSEEAIQNVVQTADRIAVIGWSKDPSRPSNDVATYLDANGYEIVPINPRYAGQAAYDTTVQPGLAALEAPVDVVLVFRQSDDVPEHVQEAIDADVPVFWMQLGIRNEAAAATLRKAGIKVVQDRCFKVEHGRLASEP